LEALSVSESFIPFKKSFTATNKNIPIRKNRPTPRTSPVHSRIKDPAHPIEFDTRDKSRIKEPIPKKIAQSSSEIELSILEQNAKNDLTVPVTLNGKIAVELFGDFDLAVDLEG
jgi:hypothetical protein